MYRKLLTTAALAAASLWSAPAMAQYPAALPAPVAAPYGVATQRIAVTAVVGQPVVAVPAVSMQLVPAVAPLSVVSGPTGTLVTHPRVIPSTAGTITAISPQAAYVATTPVYAASTLPVTTIVNQPVLIAQNTQVYTPTYYYYYYQQPVVAAPVVQPASIYGFGPYAGAAGPMFNARGELGHIRWPYYSYRRPWYTAGQPSFNVTIPGPVW